jgi:hypothetical protein
MNTGAKEMPRGAMNRKLVIVLGVIDIAVIIATVGLFLTFRPTEPRYTFWIVLGDLVLFEAFFGAYLIYNLLLTTERRSVAFPPAMHVAIENTIGIFFVINVAIALVFLFAFNRSAFDKALVWVIIGKWLLLATIVANMWVAGHEGMEQKNAIAEARANKKALLAKTRRALNEFRRFNPAGNEENSMKRQIIQEMEILQNLAAGWVSVPVESKENDGALAGLLDQSVSEIGKLMQCPKDDCSAMLLRVQSIIRKTSSELQDSLATTKKG